MRIAFICLALASVALGQSAPPAAEARPPVGDAKSSVLNAPGYEYPMVDSSRRAIFRVVAPDAKAVVVSLGKLALTKGENGVWTGTSAPLAVGFHYYSVQVDGAS